MASENFGSCPDVYTAPAINSAEPLILQRDGGRLLLITGDSLLRRSRLMTRLGGVSLVAAGVAGAVAVHPALCVLVAVGLFIALVIPGRLHVQRLLEVNETDQTIRSLQAEVEQTTVLPIQDIVAIEGQYQTQGWEGVSRIYATRQEGTPIPLLHFYGTNERLAETACALLGSLFHCPATYIGPFGEEKQCHTEN